MVIDKITVRPLRLPRIGVQYWIAKPAFVILDGGVDARGLSKWEAVGFLVEQILATPGIKLANSVNVVMAGE